MVAGLQGRGVAVRPLPLSPTTERRAPMAHSMASNGHDTSAMLDVQDITTYYGNIQALKGVTLHVNQGEIVTLIGSNGAGKTTTLQTISGLLRPRTGAITLNGK